MPQTRNSRSRACKDLSKTKTRVQTSIDFPNTKRKESKAMQIVGKKRSKVNDENCFSPLKSPRIVESPLADVTNTSINNHPNEFTLEFETVEYAKRKLSVGAPPDDSSYTKLCKVLHNSIPKELISREKELKVLHEFVQSCVVESTPGSLYICGAPGTGKTACLTKVLEEIKGLNVKTIFLNCMTLRQSQSIFARLATLVDNSGRMYSNQEGARYLQKKLCTVGKRILLVLDEIDQLESKDQEVLYKLFEMPFLPKSRLVLIGIANSLDFTDRILPRLQTKTTCTPILLQFEPYKKEEICAILKGRIDETSKDIVDPSAIQFCARKVSAMTGDARKALDIMRRAVEIADVQAKKNPSPVKSQITKVTIGHVASVCSSIYGARLAPSSNVKFVFPLQQKIIICTALSCLKHSKVKEIVVSKLYQSYCRVSTSRHLSPVSREEFNGICNLLESQGIISIKKAKDIQNNKIALRMQESEIELALQDKSLMMSILSTSLC